MIKQKTRQKQRIDRKLKDRKIYLLREYPICIFCLKPVGNNAELAHKIRRSWSSQYWSDESLQTHPMNTGLAHPNCHDIFDNQPEKAKQLPGYGPVMNDIKALDPDYYAFITELQGR